MTDSIWVDRNCKICGREFRIVRSRADAGRGRFCSRKCYLKWNCRHWIVRICENCGKEFLAKPSRVERGEARYCSRVCSNNASRVRTVKTCEYCGKEFAIQRCREKYQSRFFCSGECYRSWKSRLRVGRVCEICGMEFAGRTNARFCSQSCWGRWIAEHWTGDSSPSWQGGRSFEPYPLGWKDHLKKAIRERDGERCVVCGAVGHLHVHHINFDKADLSPLNLVTLCNRCHGNTQKDRAYWICQLADRARKERANDANAAMGAISRV